MSRRLKQAYRCESLGELARQLLFAPPARRVDQVRRAERLHDEIDPGRTYPVEFLIYRLTGYRPESADSLLLVGEAVRPDLRLMIDQLSRSVTMPAEDDDCFETVQNLARRMDVSTKTIGRWRRAGLRWRWMCVNSEPTGRGRKQIVIARSALEHFQTHNSGRVERAKQFTLMALEKREAIIERARRLAEATDASFNEIAHHLARRTGRALETVRLVLDKHDRSHPENPIFIDRSGPLSPRQRRVIARAFRMGVSVSQLTRRFGRTRATIYRTIHQQRAAAARRLSLSYVASPVFEREDAETVILRAGSVEDLTEQASSLSRVPVDDLPLPLQPLFVQPSLPAARVRSLFIRLNYLKWKACRIREGLHRHEPRGSQLDAFERYVHQAEQLQGQIVSIHRPVLLSVARRHMTSEPLASQGRLLVLLESGQWVLLKAVQQFNASRSVTFESYLTNRLLQHFAAAPLAAARARRRRSSDELVTSILRIEPTSFHSARLKRVERRTEPLHEN